MHCTSPGNRISGSSDVGGGGSDTTQTIEHNPTVQSVSTMTNNNNNNDITTINNGGFIVQKLQLNNDAVQTDSKSGGVASSTDVAQKIYDDPCELMAAEWPSPMHLPRSRSWFCCPNSVTIEGETPKLHRQISCEYSLVTEEPKLRNGGSGTHTGVSEGIINYRLYT